MSFFGNFVDPNPGYMPDRRFVPADNENGPDRRAKWFHRLKMFEDGEITSTGKPNVNPNGLPVLYARMPWEDRLDFYKEDGTKLGKFVIAGPNSFYFWPQENRYQNPNQIASSYLSDFTFAENYKNKANQNEKIYYSDPKGTYKMLYNYTGAGGRRRRRRTKTRRHKSRRRTTIKRR